MQKYFCSILLSILVHMPNSAHAWSLKTHLWVAQQVLDDVNRSDGLAPDCNVRLEVKNQGKRAYKIPDDVCTALKAHPENYRSGHLGPDVFPDPVSGQMTTHPGLERGWSTERWLRQVLESASAPEDLALGYGFVGHAAGDIFAHTYVNQYAGDIFLLNDKETRVELRHFALEKYIESKTPPAGPNGAALPFDASTLRVSRRYLSELLIFNDDVSTQYFKEKLTFHLASLHQLRKGVLTVANAGDDVQRKLIDVLAKYYKLRAPLLGDLNQALIALKVANVALDAAQETLRLADEALDLKRKLVDLTKKAIEEAENIIAQIPSSIEVQLKIAEEAAKLVGNLNSELNTAVGRVLQLKNDVNKLVCSTTHNVCTSVTSKVCSWLGPFSEFCKDVTETACNVVTVVNPQCGVINNLIQQAENTVREIEGKIVEQATKETAALAEKARLEVESTRQLGIKLAKRSVLIQLEAEQLIQEKSLDASRKIAEESQKVVKKVESEVEKIKDKLKPIEEIIDKVADFAKKFNPVALLIQNWKDGIARAGDEFIGASAEVGITMVTGQGNPMEPYIKWFHCSFAAYAGTPWQLSNAYCSAQDAIKDVMDEVDKLKQQLPWVIRFLLDPLEEIKKRALAVAKKEAWKAGADASDFVFGPPTGRFILMLANQEKASAENLTSVFSTAQNDAGKKLLTIPDIVSRVNKDIGLSNDVLDPQSFHALSNAVVLAKLSLLDANELNRLYRDLAGAAPTIYGNELYGDQVGKRFSLLFYAIKSIDGNHQWQAFGLPYPRDASDAEPIKHADRQHGHSPFYDPRFGFRLFSDGSAREQVFHRVFAGPIDGSIAEVLERLNPPYPYPACEQFPFPMTIDDKGNMQLSDERCRKKVPTGVKQLRYNADGSVVGATLRSESSRPHHAPRQNPYDVNKPTDRLKKPRKTHQPRSYRYGQWLRY